MGTRAAIAFLAVSLVAAARGDEEENRRRLEAMPREQRLHLAKTLDEYDALPGPDRAAIRDLDAAVAKLHPDVQARYRLLLRHYHVWVNGLDDAQRAQLDKAPSLEAKLALVTKWRKADREADTRANRNMIFGVHLGELATLPPVEMANTIRSWQKLSDKEKAEVEKSDRIHQRLQAVRKFGLQRGVVPRPFPAAREEDLLARLAKEDRVRAVFPKQVNEIEAKAEAEKSEADPARKLADARKRLVNPLHQLAESLYFAEHPPQAVTPARLEQFEAEMPGWLRATFDSLPPDDARRRLAILYRQVYPAPEEIPPPAKPDPAAAKARPATKPGGATTPAPPASF
jgi:hypothetical protein